MKRFRSRQPVDHPTHETSEDHISSDLDANERIMQRFFQECADIVFRSVPLQGEDRALLIFIAGIVKVEELNMHVLQPLLKQTLSNPNRSSFEHITTEGNFTLTEVTTACTFSEVLPSVLDGAAVLFTAGKSEALLLNVKGGTRRSVEEPTTEAVIRGPREGFNESIGTNLALLRFKIKSERLKTVSFTVGTRTQTQVMLVYLEDLINPDVLREVKQRLADIRMDAVLESGYIEEMIEDEPFSPFPQLQYSERPDTVASQLLEGRFAIFVDGTPFVLTGPVTFWQFMQASEDYYERYMISTLIRWLRYVFLLLALYLPALYVAVTTFHQDMLPTNLLLSVATARESIPFPALVEALIMEVAFEALREAGIRLPKTVGQAVSILGALVIGQAAVQAGIVSAPMVIIVSLTGIASFTIPRFNAAISVRMLRFPFMIFAGAFGLFGLVICTIWLITHLCTLRSFGVPYLSGITPVRTQELKDVLVRTPWWRMSTRPGSFAERNKQRIRKHQVPEPPAKGRKVE